jgi:hypothetical protein
MTSIMYNKSTPQDFGLLPSDDPETYLHPEDGSMWKFRALNGFGDHDDGANGYYRLPMPGFEELIRIVMDSQQSDDIYGAASVLLDDHADELLDRCLEMLDEDEAERYLVFFERLHLGRPENRSPITGKKYVQIAEDHRRWDVVSARVTEMAQAKSEKLNWRTLLRNLFR